MPLPSTHASQAQAQAQAAWIQGQQLGRQGRWAEAARRFGQAARLQPRDALYAMNLADAHLKCGDAASAAEAASAARRADPDSPLAVTLLANALLASHRHDALHELLASVPADRLGLDELGLLAQAQLETGRLQQAVGTCMQALAKRPTDATMYLRLAEAFKGLAMRRELLECLRTALALGVGPRQVVIGQLLAFHEREVCDWQGGDTQERQLRQSVLDLAPGQAIETAPFALTTLLDDPLLQLRGAQACALQVLAGVQPLPPRVPEQRQRIRLGYVSCDFHSHATAYLMAELLERHDRGRFEVFLYSHGPDDDRPVRRRIVAAAEHFADVRPMGARALAERIRADGIDILVDLKGYTQGARPSVFAHRPAPVQVGYLGFPGTTGAPWLDYVVGDPVVTPLADAAHYSEQIAQLPGCYQCNDGTRPLPVAPSRASLGLPQQALVLCAFNQPYKISPQVFDVWCGLLRQLPQAVLWLLDWSPLATAALRREAVQRGVRPEQLHFAPNLPQREHLDRTACADLFLDTWPCTGHTTASDMLWAGVPVVTLRGRSFASRVAASLLHAVGLPELVCDDLAQYQALVLALAHDAVRRQALAARVAAARSSSPLFSGAALARQLEPLFERMWQRALAGLPPAPLAAEAAPAPAAATALATA